MHLKVSVRRGSPSAAGPRRTWSSGSFCCFCNYKAKLIKSDVLHCQTSLLELQSCLTPIRDKKTLIWNCICKSPSKGLRWIFSIELNAGLVIHQLKSPHVSLSVFVLRQDYFLKYVCLIVTYFIKFLYRECIVTSLLKIICFTAL